MIYYHMRRNNETVAEIVTLSSGKCIVSWPTSVIVYDSEDAARKVHIDHMGGRGEVTRFIPILGSKRGFDRGLTEAMQDHFENCVRTDTTVPDYIPPDEKEGWLEAYTAFHGHQDERTPNHA
jgi:hypothetical protein